MADKALSQKTARARQSAELLGIAQSTLWRWHRERHDFPRGRRLSPRCCVWDVAELLAWRDAHLVQEVQ